MAKSQVASLQLISRKKVASLTGYSTLTISRWEKSGKLRPISLTRHPRYKLSDVEKLIREAQIFQETA